MLWFHPLPCALPECCEQFKVRWEWYSFSKMLMSMFLFVMRAPGIAVKLWFCFWWGTVTGASTCVAFTALICEHKNANISVGGLFQLSCVIMLESGISVWLTLLYQDLVSCWWLIFAFIYSYLQPWTVGCCGSEHKCLFQQEEMFLNRFINLILIKHSLHIVI